MGDISTWSPVDESNTLAPPNGWPENQPTNTVNNCARAMMGAMRRFYDTVTAQLATLANYLPLSGGSLTGALSAPQYKLDNVPFAMRDPVANWHGLFDADGIDPAVIMSGAVGGYQNYYRAETHNFQSNNGSVTFATLNYDGINLGGVRFAGRDVANNYHVLYDADGASALFLGGGVAAHNYHRAETHTFQSNNGAATFAIFNASGIYVGGTGSVVVGGSVSASGYVVGTVVTGDQVNSNGPLTTAGNINCNGAIDCVGNIDAGSYTRNGVPMVMLTEAQMDRIEERLARLERVGVRETA